MELTNLPGQVKTKKELIRYLVLHHPQTSADEIARKANTTKQYVWKEKSIMGSKTILAERTTTITAQRKDETTFLASDSAVKGRIQSSPTKYPIKSYGQNRRISRSNCTISAVKPVQLLANSSRFSVSGIQCHLAKQIIMPLCSTNPSSAHLDFDH
jgi:hypothetical protein